MSDANDPAPPRKVVYLMRGLPSSGKSHTARELAGVTGVVCETDAYFFSEVGDDPSSYDYDRSLVQTARHWNLERFKAAVDDGRSPVVVDRGNSLSLETQIYARYAAERDYAVELREPDSPWWQEIRILLKYKQFTEPVLLEWSKYLAAMNRSTHRVSVSSIRRRMRAWKHDLTIEDIFSYRPGDGAAAAGERRHGDSAGDQGGRGVVRIDPRFGGLLQMPPLPDDFLAPRGGNGAAGKAPSMRRRRRPGCSTKTRAISSASTTTCGSCLASRSLQSSIEIAVRIAP